VWRRIYSGLALKDVVFAGLSVAAFVVALLVGEGLNSLAYLAAGAWWLLLGRYWAKRARRSQRTAELRARRLRREAEGLAPRREDH
jgi:hypothetical protein